VPDLLEALQRFASDALRRRVGGCQAGMGGLDLAKFAQEQIVIAI